MVQDKSIELGMKQISATVLELQRPQDFNWPKLPNFAQWATPWLPNGQVTMWRHIYGPRQIYRTWNEGNRSSGS